jgi:hypothetical protein
MTLVIRSPMELPAHPRAFRTQLVSALVDDRSYRKRSSGVRAWGTYVSRGLMETVDELVDRQRLPRVDLVKLDLDGLELSALMGARETIRVHRPRLVISLAHGRDDLVTIPARLDALAADYDFFLDSVAPGDAGPWLFARPRPDLTLP